MKGPLSRYQELVKSGDLQPDPVQEDAVRHLQHLHKQMVAPQSFVFWRKAAQPKGLYLWGGVGRGKSLIMDLFFHNTDFEPKARLHFHEFMIGVHDDIANWRGMDDATRKSQPWREKNAELDDPIPHVARKAWQKAHLLCFDEFQVTDVADALLLGRLFESLFALGTTIVTTSNRPPDDLYKDGLNRQLFLPFIDMLKTELTVMELDAARDYRQHKLQGRQVYFSPLTSEATKAMDEAWCEISTGAREHAQSVTVRGREILLPRTARDAVRTTFAEMCGKPLGAEDYLAIAQKFPVVFLENIPRLSSEKRNEAKRFVTLIDALYENRTRLICSADAEPEALYPAGDGSFEFERTASRLREMQGEEWLEN